MKDSPTKRVARADTTYLVTNMMRSVLSEGTGAAVRASGFSLDAAGKTGTTNDLRDAWFVGFTPELLTVVWVGLDDNQALGLSGAQAALPIWTAFMQRALAGHGDRAFDVPETSTSSTSTATPAPRAMPGCLRVVQRVVSRTGASRRKSARSIGSKRRLLTSCALCSIIEPHMSQEVFEALTAGARARRRGGAGDDRVGQGSTPQRVGAKMVVFPDGRTVGTIGGGCYENDAFWKAKEAIQSRKPQLVKYDLNDDFAQENGLVCGGQMQVYIEPLEATPRLYVIGAGHVGYHLGRLAHTIGFRTHVLDDREKFANKERFPTPKKSSSKRFPSGCIAPTSRATPTSSS